MRKKTQDEILEKFVSLHGDLYDYSKVIYVGSKDKVEIICNRCRESFMQSPSRHLERNGCPKCRHNKKDSSKYFEEVSILHNNRYEYLSEYVNAKEKIKIKCKECDCIFEQRASAHLTLEQGCPSCFGTKLITNDEFINISNEKHNNKYIYDKTNYIGRDYLVIIICPKHGDFEQKASRHMFGGGCRKCYNESITNDVEYFIEKSKEIHGDKYIYDKSIYIKGDIPLIVTCKDHGDFEIKPFHHTIQKVGCTKCSKSYKILENRWLDQYNIPDNFRRYHIKLDDASFFVDGFDPNTNTIYEFYGDYWHGNPEIFNGDDCNRNNGIKYSQLYENTLNRERILIDNGYNIISIWENDYLNTEIEY